MKRVGAPGALQSTSPRAEFPRPIVARRAGRHAAQPPLNPAPSAHPCRPLRAPYPLAPGAVLGARESESSGGGNERGGKNGDTEAQARRVRVGRAVRTRCFRAPRRLAAVPRSRIGLLALGSGATRSDPGICAGDSSPLPRAPTRAACCPRCRAGASATPSRARRRVRRWG